MVAHMMSAGLDGMDVQLVQVEVDVSDGVPGWHMVGLPEAAVKESKERVAASVRNSGVQLLARKITVNLSPAQWRKVGSLFDLPIALAWLADSEVITIPSDMVAVGELALGGALLPIPGVLPIAMQARERGYAQLMVPLANMAEASLVSGLKIIGMKDLAEAITYCEGKGAPLQVLGKIEMGRPSHADMSEVRGQEAAKRALLIAAAGGHNVVMVSTPGAGKTMLAERFPGLLPPLSEAQVLDTSRIYSVCGKLSPEAPVIMHPPFRSPHHSASRAGMCGGGSRLTVPGEVSLAHHGVLFMDELPEFRRDVLEALREPLEAGHVTISRSGRHATLPARFQLISAMNPCPCGFYGHPKMRCRCSMAQVLAYRGRVSGPLMDRIDLQVGLDALSSDQILEEGSGTSTATLSEQVMACRERQVLRLAGRCNAQMRVEEIGQHCKLDRDSRLLLKALTQKGVLTGRGLHRVLKVARTIADLEGTADLRAAHVAEAAQYRTLDRPL